MTLQIKLWNLQNMLSFPKNVHRISEKVFQTKMGNDRKYTVKTAQLYMNIKARSYCKETRPRYSTFNYPTLNTNGIDEEGLFIH